MGLPWDHVAIHSRFLTAGLGPYVTYKWTSCWVLENCKLGFGPFLGVQFIRFLPHKKSEVRR